MKKITSTFWIIILIFFLRFSYQANATTNLVSGNDSTAPIDNLLLNFTWFNNTFIGTSGTDFNATLNVTFNLPLGMYYIAGSASTNTTGNLSNISSNDTTITFGNSTDDIETSGWFAFNVSANASGAYAITANETYDINGTSKYVDNNTIILNINKVLSSINLSLNDTENNNRSYALNQIANFTAILNVSGRNISLESDCTSWYNLTNVNSPASNTTNLTCSGLFFIKAYWDGDGNYSASSKTYYFDTISPQYSILYPGSSESYGFNKTYWFNITWSDATINQTWFQFNNSSSSTNLFNQTFNLNSSGLYWINSTRDYPAGDYNYKWCANDSLGNTTCTNNTNFSITRPPPIPLLSINPSSIFDGNQTTVNCTKNGGDPSSILRLFRNGTVSSFGSDTSNVIYLHSPGAGYYIWNCTIDASQNYSWNYVTGDLTVSSVPATITPTPTPSGSFTVTPSSSSVTIKPGENSSLTITLKNTYSYNITNINITVSGINTSWYSLNKVNISRLQRNGGNDTVLLTLNVPNDAERKSYSIIVSAVGKDSGVGRLTRQVSITLIVPVEAPQNATNNTNNTNETGALNNTGIEGQNNQTNVTGLSIRLDEIKDYIVLIIASVAVILIFVFRNDFTDLIRGNKPKVHPEHKVHEETIAHTEPKKLHHILSHVKKKISSLNEHRLVIQIKKKEKKEEEKT